MGYIIMEKQNQLYYKACLCSYCGDNYNGWQRQKNAIGIQNILENTLSSLYNHEILIAGSGRTDTNVHALGQVFHFSSSKYFDTSLVAAIIIFGVLKLVVFPSIITSSFRSR